MRAIAEKQMEGLKSSQIYLIIAPTHGELPGCSRRCAKGKEKARSIVRLGTFRYAASTIEPD